MANENAILHLVVIGFHHKKGYQVDYSYPPIYTDTSNDSVDCPNGWKYLPTLALPDGSHNFTEDTVFFNLPSLTDPRKTVYGISCYRQIPVEKLKIRTADVTRSTVQKAVCALVTHPLYGYIEVKLSLIAQSFFDQGDFSNTDIIRKAYDHLSLCLSEKKTSLLSQIHVGLSIRDVILRWRHKTLILFKLMLLQKKVICFGSPVRPICTLILSILSLHPNLLETGFSQAACVKPSRPMSPMPEFPIEGDDEMSPSIVEATIEDEDLINERKVSVCIVDNNELKMNVAGDMNGGGGDDDKQNMMPRDASVDTLANSLLPLCTFDPSAWNAPLPLFTNGTLCLPYLSLPYLDLLSDPSVNGYLVGTSNILFRQKRQLMDVFIDIENSTIEAHDPELRRQISLTTEDLRFIDFVVRHVQFPKEDAEGSEAWIKRQFQGYMLAMLRTVFLSTENSKEIEHFNSNFIAAWKQTDGYISWTNDPKSSEFNFEDIQSGHPFAGTLSVNDIKNKIAQTMNNSESARKLNQAVNTTSKAVGGAILQARGAISNFWSSFTAPTTVTATPVSSDSSNDSQPDFDSDSETIAANGSRKAQTQSETNKNGKNKAGVEQLEENFKRLDSDKPIVNLKEEKDTGADVKHGIVEIGHEANALDVSSKSGKVADS